MVVLLGGLVATVVILLTMIMLYNGLVLGKNIVDEAWSSIEVLLKQRHDLIPNVVRIVREYAAHEHSLFEEISTARTRSLNMVGNPAALATVENVLSRRLQSLFVVAESYPDLKANDSFLQLQESLARLEDEIQMARRYYNGVVRDQNTRVQQFPGCLVASIFGFISLDLFELDQLTEKNIPDTNVLLH